MLHRFSICRDAAYWQYHRILDLLAYIGTNTTVAIETLNEEIVGFVIFFPQLILRFSKLPVMTNIATLDHNRPKLLSPIVAVFFPPLYKTFNFDSDR